MNKFKIAAPLAALVLPLLLTTSVFAQGKMTDKKPAMSGSKMSGSKMSGGKMSGGMMMSPKGLVPVSGKMPSKSEMMGAKVVSSTMMHGKPCYTVRLKSGKSVQMCKAGDKKAMMGHMGGKMSGGKMSGDKMHGKM